MRNLERRSNNFDTSANICIHYLQHYIFLTHPKINVSDSNNCKITEETRISTRFDWIILVSLEQRCTARQIRRLEKITSDIHDLTLQRTYPYHHRTRNKWDTCINGLTSRNIKSIRYCGHDVVVSRRSRHSNGNSELARIYLRPAWRNSSRSKYDRPASILIRSDGLRVRKVSRGDRAWVAASKADCRELSQPYIRTFSYLPRTFFFFFLFYWRNTVADDIDASGVSSGYRALFLQTLSETIRGIKRLVSEQRFARMRKTPETYLAKRDIANPDKKRLGKSLYKARLLRIVISFTQRRQYWI